MDLSRILSLSVYIKTASIISVINRGDKFIDIDRNSSKLYFDSVTFAPHHVSPMSSESRDISLIKNFQGLKNGFIFSRILPPLDVTGPSSRARAINKVTVAVISAMHDWELRRFPVPDTLVGINYS